MSSEKVKREVRGHLRVFVALLVLAVVSATLSMLSEAPLIAVVLVIAAVQGALILAYLMHVKGEGALIQSLLAFSAFFLIILFLFTLLGLSDTIEGTESLAEPAAVSDTAANEEH